MTAPEGTDVGMKMSTGIKIYLAVLGCAGAGIMIGTYFADWGFWGWFGGGLLLFAGWGSLIGNHFKVGWQPAVGPCPQCGTRLHFLTKKQYLRCVGCQTMLAVQGQNLTVVPGNAVADTPTLPVPYLPTISFPPLCMLCGQPATQADTVRWDKHRQKADVIVATVIEVTKITVQVPVCAHHANQKAVDLDYGDHPSTQHDGVSLRFRSLHGLELFRHHNAAVMPPIRNEAQMPHAPSAEA